MVVGRGGLIRGYPQPTSHGDGDLNGKKMGAAEEWRAICAAVGTRRLLWISEVPVNQPLAFVAFRPPECSCEAGWLTVADGASFGQRHGYLRLLAYPLLVCRFCARIWLPETESYALQVHNQFWSIPSKAVIQWVLKANSTSISGREAL